MNLYITTDNQKLLWDLICNKSTITNYFQYLPPNNKFIWFKQIIQKHYNENSNINNYTQLKDLNKKTILYMLNDIPSQNQMNTIQTNNIITPEIEVNKKSDDYQDQYNNRINDYQNMLKKDVPTEIDFTNKQYDDVITNMDELLRIQQESRKLDIQHAIIPNKKLNIDRNSNNIDIEIESLVKIENKKQISWGENKIYFDNNESAEQLVMYHEDFMSIRNQFHYINNEINNIKKLLHEKPLHP